MKSFFKKTAVLVAAGLLIGCAGAPKPEPPQKASGKWQSRNINADGNKEDWPKSAPQYKNSETDTRIWISNNSEQIFLLAETEDPGIIRQLTRGGLILSVKTKEKDAKPFSIQLKGRTQFRPRGGSGHDQGRPPAPTPDVKLPDSLVVTYPFSSSPITMSIKEAGITGITLGLSDAGRHTLIFEAVIPLEAIFFNLPRIAGTVINIELSAKGRSFAMAQRKKPEGDKKEERPQEGPPGAKHGPGKPDDTEQTKGAKVPFNAAIEITLTGPSE